MGTETIPVVICALGVIKKGLEKYIEEIPGTVTIGELQKKITILGDTSHPQKSSVNQVNSLVAKALGFDLVLQRLTSKSRVTRDIDNNNNNNSNNNNN